MPDEDGKMTEAEAIAKAIQIGEEMQRDSNSDTAWYAKRIGLGISVFGFMLLLLLIAYTIMNKSGERPIVALLFIAAIIAGGAITTYWGYTNSKGPSDNDF
ncbi:MAG: hypothetical protein VCD00_12030 [Candidatus Hydrogenedentota bacterium]